MYASIVDTLLFESRRKKERKEFATLNAIKRFTKKDFATLIIFLHCVFLEVLSFLWQFKSFVFNISLSIFFN